MKINCIPIACIFLLIMTIGAVNAADNSTQSDVISLSDFANPDDLPVSLEDDNGTLENDFSTDFKTLKTAETDYPILKGSENNNEASYDNKYYLFRGDCWIVNNNFESSAAITSESFNDLNITGTFRTINDIVGLYWNSQDPIQHPYISYGSRSDYSDVILEFDYEMTGCMDFSQTTITIAANSGETYYLSMDRFTENNHVTLNFNNLTLLPGNSYFDSNGQGITVSQETKLNVTDLKMIMFLLVPTNFVSDNQYTIMENTNFTCRISNITVANGEICDEQTALEPHQYSLCEGYDDSYNLNPYRLAREMRKLGYSEWVDLYIGASYFYEKSGNASDVITDLNLNHNRTEKMLLDKDVPLNAAFRAWLDCYSRELKKNGIQNLIISVSMENLQCPPSWRQMELNGTYAVSGWAPGTFLYSPCNDDVIPYMRNVSEACLDIVVNNGFKPILQIGETWWWWNEKPYFYDNSTREKYLAEYGTALPEYNTVRAIGYNETAMKWLNRQMVQYIDALREVVKGERYANGLYMALFYPPSVTDINNIPPMIIDVNYLQDAYSPNKLDILQIEDYDWVIYENPQHSESYSIGQELGFSKDQLHYFGGFVQNPEDAARYWSLIEESMNDAIENNFKEVFVWAGPQVRRDSKILGYDEYVILHNLALTNQPGIVSPIITAPDYVGSCENFTVRMHTDDWVGGTFNVYEYDGKKGNLLASNTITDGNSSVVLSSAIIGLNRFYLEFDYANGKHHSILEVYIIENSQNITVNVSREVEIGSDASIEFSAPKGTSSYVYISVDGNGFDSHLVENGEFSTAIPSLSDGYHSILIKYNDGQYVDGKLVGEVYYKTFTVKVGVKTSLEAGAVNTTYGSNDQLVVTLKDSAGNPLNDSDILITLDGITHHATTDNYGKATLTIDVLPENYTAEISYAGDDIYLSSFATANITVNKIKTALSADNVTFTYGDSTNLTVTLKDIRGNYLKGKNVTITLDGITHNLTTNNEGQATLLIESLPGNYTAEITFKEDNVYLGSYTTANITINKIKTSLNADNVTFTYSNPTNLTVTLKDIRGNYLKGKNVTITLDGRTHNITTDDDGKATLLIESLPGNYTAEITFKEDNVYLGSCATSNITINKIKTSLNADNITFTYSDPTNLTVTLKDNKDNLLKGKNVTITLDGTAHNITTDDDGKATLLIESLPGNYTAEITFKEDNVYLGSYATSNITINKIKTGLSADNITFTYDNPTNLTVTLKDNKGNYLKWKNVTITLDGTTHNLTTDNNGKATLLIEPLPGNYTAEISFKEDNIYLASSTTANITINKIKTSLSADNVTFTYSNPTNLTVTLTDDKGNYLKGKNVTITLDGTAHNLTTDNEGKATLLIESLPGNYTAETSFREDNVYLGSCATSNITINKIKTDLSADNVTFTYSNPTNLTVTLTDDKGNYLKEKNITITLDGTTHNLTTDDTGKATLLIEPLPGNYTAEISFKEDNIYLASCATSNITINKIKTGLSADNVTFTYSDPTNLTVTLKDYKNNALNGKNVTITLDGITHNLTTNNDGQATLLIESLPGNYTAKITFKEDKIYLASYTTAKITINKIKTGLSADNITFTYDNPTNLTVTLKDDKGNYLNGKNVTITLDGITHNLTTNNNGQATLLIESLPGNYTVKITFKEDEIYLASYTTANITINKIKTGLNADNITFTYDNPTNLTVTLKDNKNNTLKGKNLTITLDGKIFNVTTDNNGKSTLTIESLPGNYTAKITFKEDEIYLASYTTANITINKIKTGLSADNVTFTYDNPTNLTVTLKDDNGNYLKGKNVTITLDGTAHNLTTDNNGKSTLTIESLPGNYTAKITFKEDEIYLPSFTTSNVTINKIATSLSTDNVTFTYSDPTNLTVTLTDDKGNYLKGKNITITLDGTAHNLTTDDDGKATLLIESLPGNYTSKITFKENEIYLPSFTTSNVAINKIATSLSANNVTFTYSDPTNLTVTLKDNKNNLLKGKNITITLDGTAHNLTTDNNGKSTLTIESLPGNYTAKITFKEDKIYLPTNTTAKITINKIKTSLSADNITFIFSDPSNLTATLKDDKGNNLKDKKVIITLDGTTHNMTTDKNGQATLLPIETLPGNYTAEISYTGDEIYLPSFTSSNVAINKIATSLSANNVTFTYSDPTNLTVTLKDNKDNNLKDKEVMIILDGSTHNLTTDENGKATLLIESLPGNYTAEITFKEDKVYLASYTTAKITINKIKTSLSAENVTFTYSDPTNLTVTLKDNKGNNLKGKNVTITLDGTAHNLTTDNNGKATLAIESLPGNYTADITFKEDKVYLVSSTTAKITINKIKTSLSADNITFIFSDPTNLTVTLKDSKYNYLKEKEIQITLDGTTHNLTTDNAGKTTLAIESLPGNYTSKITFKEDKIYLASYTTASIVINKIATSLSANNVTFIYSNPTNLTVTLKDSKGNYLKDKKVIIILDESTHNLTTDKNGQATLLIESLPGNYTAKITFKEDKIYLSSYTTAKITINKIKTTLDANDISFIYGNPTNLAITLKDNNGNNLKDKEVLITLDGSTHILTTDKNGQATLAIESLPGNYTAKITFKEDKIYLPTNTTANIVINKIETSLSANNVIFIYGNPTNMTVALKDNKGNNLKDKEVIITLDGTTHNLTTDKNGKTTLAIDSLPGNYTAKITFKEDKIYLPSSTTANIVINKIETSLSANDVTFIYGNPTNLTTMLKDNKGNYLKDKEIIITLDGTTHNLTTDKNGQATLKIESLPGNYTAKITFKEDKIYLSSYTTAKITINKIKTALTADNVTFTYGDSTNLTITLNDNKNNALIQKNIIITLDGTTHNLTTDKNGQAILKINSLPGNYTAEITFKENEIYLPTNITANVAINKIATSLSTYNITFTYSDPTNLTVTLKDNKNNALIQKNIIITLDAATHNLTTDKNGQATLKINSLPGNYTAEITFKEDKIYLPTNTTAKITINKIKTTLDANDISFIYGNPTNLAITLKDNKGNALKGKDVLINVGLTNDALSDSIYIKTTDDKGMVSLRADYDAGIYLASISFSGDEKYLASSAESTIAISKISTRIITSDIVTKSAKQNDLMVILEDEKGYALSGFDIIVSLDGNEFISTTDKLGQVKLPLSLNAGNYTANIRFMGTQNYDCTNKNVKITVLDKIATILNASSIIANYGEAKNMVITLKDENGNSLIGQSIIITLNGDVYTRIIDANGQAKISVSLPANEYAAAITYAGDDTYKSASYTANVIVKKATPKITATSKTFKAKAKTKKVTATLKNKNKAIKNVFIKLTVKKRIYKAKTNSKGIATFKVKLTQRGKYNAVCKFDGNSNLKSATKKVKIIIK